MSYPAIDEQFRDLDIAKAEPFKSGGWKIVLGDGWIFCVPADSPVEPKAGMSARLYGRGLGHTVRGLFLDGVCVFYRTEAEQREEDRLRIEGWERERRGHYAEHRADYDRRVDALPAPLRARVAGFRDTSPDWAWEHEPYELAVCEAAARIADGVRVDGAGETFYRGAFDMARTMTADELDRRFPGLAAGDLSGNQSGAALRLAYLCLTDPHLVAMEHAAICPLIGCREAGCYAARARDLDALVAEAQELNMGYGPPGEPKS